MIKIKYSQIVSVLKSNNIRFESTLDSDELFYGINSISNAQKNDLTFFSNIKYVDKLDQCNAKACIIKKDYIKYLPSKCKPILVDKPYLAFAYLTYLFDKNVITKNKTISENTFLHKNSKIHKNVQIDPFTYISDNTEIYDNVIIGSNVNIGPNVIIKSNCKIHDNVSLKNCIIHENCEIKSGARIGSSGFGFEEKSKKKIIHIGNVEINHNTTIGSNTTIDRAVFDTTSIGEFSQIDNLVHIAHNVVLGKHAIIAAQTGIAGSTTIGDFVKIGGQAGIAGHLFIGDNVTIAGKSGVTKNISDNKIVAGFPAKDISIWKREIIKMSKNNEIKS